jgi:trigger factor
VPDIVVGRIQDSHRITVDVMQVTETVATGLKRELHVVIPKGDIDQRYAARLNNVKDTIQLKGFRKGKVPATHIKKLYGRSIMAEVVQEALDESSKKAITDRNERPAIRPKIDMTEDKAEIERILTGQSDLAYKMSFEILPDIALTDFTALKLEREVVEVAEDEIDKGVTELAQRSTTFEDDATRAAADGDQVRIDFVGKIDGEAFEGGTGQDMPIVLGRGGFIPGFEDGLKGAKAGDSRQITATFPEAYNEAKLAGKTATFDTLVRAVGAPKAIEINDEFAKTLGVDTLVQLRDILKGQISSQYEQFTRMKLKRQLLDELDKTHTFQLPESLVQSEFDGIWGQATEGLKTANKTFESEGKTEESAREEYRKIAERRVRLGLVIGEVGDKNKIQVTQDELRRSLMDQVRRFPGQEQMVYDFYDKNPAALTELRAPIFEDKVVDFIVDLAKPSVKTVSREALMKSAEDEDGTATPAA